MKYTNKLKLLVIFTGLFIVFFVNAGIANTGEIPATNSSEYMTGKIDRLTAEEIVIDDSLYKYAKDFKFLSRQGAIIEARWFKKGDKVRFKINIQNDAQVTIVRKT